MESENIEPVVEANSDILGESSDSEIEVKPKATPSNSRVGAQPQKRVLSDKQKETLVKGREKRDALRRERLAEKQKQEEVSKKVLEEKIVKKAIQIKKKQIKKEKIVEPSDDESSDLPPPPTPKMRRTVSHSPYPPAPMKPAHKIIFV